MISFIILNTTSEGIYYTLESIIKNCNINYEVIIVNTAETFESEEYNRYINKVIDLNEFSSNSSMINLGMESASGDFCFIIKEGCYINLESILNMIEALKNNKIGIVVPKTNKNVLNQGEFCDISDLAELENKMYEVVNREKRYIRTMRISDSIVGITKNTFETIGRFDERFKFTLFEYDDLVFKAIKDGFEIIVVGNSFIPRKNILSMTNEQYNIAMKENYQYLKNKWGIDIFYNLGCRSELVDMISLDKEREINVLEIGCSTGATLTYLKNVFEKANLYGIELNKNCNKIAYKDINYFVGDCYNEIKKLRENYFQCIILGDILEHLVNPNEILKMLKKYLKFNGELIISIPNINHYTVIKDLINGSFNYSDFGILDKTHLRFYTYSTFKILLEECGYIIKEVKRNIVYKERDEKFINTLCDISGDKNLKEEYKTYQYYLRVCKND